MNNTSVLQSLWGCGGFKASEVLRNENPNTFQVQCGQEHSDVAAQLTRVQTT